MSTKQQQLTEARSVLAGLFFESSDFALPVCQAKADRILGLLQTLGWSPPELPPEEPKGGARGETLSSFETLVWHCKDLVLECAGELIKPKTTFTDQANLIYDLAYGALHDLESFRKAGGCWPRQTDPLKCCPQDHVYLRNGLGLETCPECQKDIRSSTKR